MIFPPGATSKSLDVQIVDDSGLPVTGLVAATFPAVYWSLAGNTESTAISLSDLAAITTAYTSGGVKERDGSAGVYRIDLPDAALTNAGAVRVYGEASGKHLICEAITVVAAPLDAAGVRNAVGLASANLDTQLADLPTVAEFEARTLLAADYGTATAVGDLPTAEENAAALLDLTDGVETDLTPREAMRLFAAALGGVLSGGGTTTITIKGAGVATTRVTATVDEDGNRSAVTLNLGS